MSSLHHIALTCRDLGETHRFYAELLGFRLVHAEIQSDDEGGWLKHAFYDLGDGGCLAFFELHGMGEPGPEELRTDISTGLGLPAWANHIAVRATAEQAAAVKERLEAAGRKVDMELDHGWCRSLYLRDPDGIVVEFTVDTPGFTPDPTEALKIIHTTSPMIGDALDE